MTEAESKDTCHDAPELGFNDLGCALKAHDVPAGLNDRVLARARALRAEAASEAQRERGPHRPRCVLSRRGFVLGGAAALAGLGALGLGLATLGDGGSPLPPATSRFGLQVARASENASGRAVFELEPTARGLVPVSTSQILMNMLVEGEGIASLVYHISQTPTVTTLVNVATVGVDGGVGGIAQEQVEVPAVAFCECKRMAFYMSPVYQQTFVSREEAEAFQRSLAPAEYLWGADADTPDAQLEVDYAAGTVYYTPVYDEAGGRVPSLARYEVDARRHAAGNNGVSPNGNPYLLEVSVSADEFYASDPLLQLYWNYRCAPVVPAESGDLGSEADQALRDLLAARGLPAGPGSADDVAFAARFAARSAFVDAFGQMRNAYPEALYEWVRSCYATHMRLVAQVLSETVLTVEATFADGVAGCRNYRIDPVDDYDSVVGQRFDGLLEYNGYMLVEGVGIVDANGKPFAIDSYDMLPFWDFVIGEPDPAAPDPRLHHPLFTISDITQEVAG